MFMQCSAKACGCWNRIYISFFKSNYFDKNLDKSLQTLYHCSNYLISNMQRRTTKQMRQAIMEAPGRIVFREIPEPEPGPGQVKVKLKTIGVCGSDVHVWHGKHPYTSYPVVQGHEVAAEVVAVGPDAADYAPGQRVTIQPQVVCGQCYPCTHGMYNDCEHLKVMGFQTTGMASDYFVTEAAKLVRLPDSMDWAHGAMVEPLAVAAHGVRRFGDIQGKSAVVLGGGPIGNLVAQTCKALGAAKVLLSETSAQRLAAAQGCGLHTVNPGETPLRNAIHSYIGPDGADVIFECVGIEATMNDAIACARKGSDIVVVGVFGTPGNINMGFVQDHELRLIGTAMYRTEDYREAVRLAGAGLVDLAALITHRVPFAEYPRAYALIEEQKDRVMKIIIDM
jgi:L-iditol 2-dehydrogenase